MNHISTAVKNLKYRKVALFPELQQPGVKLGFLFHREAKCGLSTRKPLNFFLKRLLGLIIKRPNVYMEFSKSLSALQRGSGITAGVLAQWSV